MKKNLSEKYTEKFNNYIKLHYNYTYSLVNIPDYPTNKTKAQLKCIIHDNIFFVSWDKFSKGQTGCKQCVRQKIKDTNMIKYGVDETLKSDIIRTKISRTMIDKYGVECPMHSSDIKNKLHQTNISKYGVENPFGSDHVKEKIKKTMINKYGVENPAQSCIIQDKIKKTNLDRYGAEHYSKSSEFTNKCKNTNFQKYGTYYSSQKHINQEHIDILNNKDKLQELINTKSLSEIAYDFNIHYSTVSDYAKTHGIHISQSSYEIAIAHFLNSYNISFTANTRTIIAPYELDFYIPDHNLAIEFCGIYWHAENKHERMTPDYHKMKYVKCKELGITLLTIFEDEWNDDIKNKILYHLGLSNNSWLPEEPDIIADLRFGEDKILENYGYSKVEDYNPMLVQEYQRLGYDVYDCGKSLYSLNINNKKGKI